MDITRRQLFKISGATAAGLAAAGIDLGLKPDCARAETLKTENTRQTTSICPYCAVGCGIIVSTSKEDGGRIINIEGDPNHVINRGALCAKGASLSQLANNPERVTQPMYRAPYAKEWKTVSWDWALTEIVKRVKTTREATFEKTNTNGQVVNRTTAIASVGSAAMDNEECWMYQALMRSLGLVYIEHQARL